MSSNRSHSAEVVVVGGGIVGVATAYLLAKAGVECVLVERDSVGSHASGFAYGGIGAVGGAGAGSGDPGPVHAVAVEGVRLHEKLAESLPEETGIDTEFRTRPSMSLLFTEEETTAAKRDLPWKQRQDKYDVRLLDRQEAISVEPRLSPRVAGAVYVEGTYDVEPYRLVLALTEAAEKLGASVRHRTVTGLRSDAGRVRGVALDNGEIACEKVVLAMGPWGAEASAWLGVPIKVRPLKGQILRLRAPGPPFTCSIGYDGDYATTKPDGLLWAGTTEEEVGFHEQPTREARDKIMASLLRMLPSVKDVELARQTACLRPLSADRLPVLGEVPGWEGVYVATGAGRQGIALGPAMARITVDLITTGATDIPIDAFDPGRFAK